MKVSGGLDRNGQLSYLLNMTEKSRQLLDKSHYKGILFRDYRKALDSVNLQIINQKLLKYDVKGHFHTWIMNYPTDHFLITIVKWEVIKSET